MNFIHYSVGLALIHLRHNVFNIVFLFSAFFSFFPFNSINGLWITVFNVCMPICYWSNPYINIFAIFIMSIAWLCSLLWFQCVIIINAIIMNKQIIQNKRKKFSIFIEFRTIQHYYSNINCNLFIRRHSEWQIHNKILICAKSFWISKMLLKKHRKSWFSQELLL